ncbi:hypothetical protein EJB05_42961, partial [Eragrostis curvula]
MICSGNDSCGGGRPCQEHEDEFTYMYQQQQEEMAYHRMQQHFAESVPEQQQYYISRSATGASNPLHRPSHIRSPSFQSFIGGSAQPRRMSFGGAAAKNEPGQPSLSVLSFGSKASTISFSRGCSPESTDGVQVREATPDRRGRAPLNAQEHVMAERKRREKMQQLFVALATIVPDLTKTDKISILGTTVEYVKKLEEKVKTLEEQNTKRTYESTVLESKHHVSTHIDGASSSDEIATGVVGSGPVIEASVYGDTILLKMCCEQKKGVLVMVLTELENQGLSIANTSILPITDSCLSITVTAKARLIRPYEQPYEYCA